jgi:hypothetical protein
VLKRLGPGSSFLCLFVLLAFLADARVALRGNGVEASASSMQRARELLLVNKKPGDLLVHSPLFSVRELSALGDLSIGPDLPKRRLRQSRRILLLDILSQPMFGFGAPEKVLIVEGPRTLVLKIFEPKLQSRAQLFDLHTDLDRAKMKIERPAGTVVSDCNKPRGEGGRACPGQADWLYLNHREMVIDGKKTACVWAHPTTGGVIVIELPAIEAPTPDRILWLKVSAALTDDSVRGTVNGAHVDTTIMQGAVILGRIRTPNRVGVFEEEVQIKANESISLRVTSPKDGRRHHCLNAQIEAR